MIFQYGSGILPNKTEQNRKKMVYFGGIICKKRPRYWQLLEFTIKFYFNLNGLLNNQNIPSICETLVTSLAQFFRDDGIAT